MKCKEIKELLAAYANDQLPPDRKQFVESHLECCIDCRTTLADYRVIGERLALLKSTADMPDMADIKLPDLRTVKVKKPFIRIRYALAAIPVAIIVIILAVFQPWVSSSGLQAVLAKAIATMGNIQSFRVTSSPFIIFEGIDNEEMKSDAEWEFVSPDRMHLKFEMNGKTSEYIRIGEKIYFTKDTSITFPVLPSLNIPSKENALKELESIIGLRRLSDEIIDGINCVHYEGKDKSNPDTTIELWIGKEDYLVRQEIRITNNQAPKVTKYYDINMHISIEAPVDSSGNLLPGWQVQKVLPTEESGASSTIITTGTATTITSP
jgi:hypothetical protein